MSSGFDGFIQRPDNILTVEVELTVLVHPPVEVLAESFAGNREIVAVNEVILQEEMKDLYAASRDRKWGSVRVRWCIELSETTEALLGMPPIL